MDLKKIAPRYLFERKTMIGTVVFIVVFSIIFMNVYTPFSDTTWFNFHNLKEFVAMAAFYLVIISFLLISKLVLQNHEEKHLITQAQLLGWVVGEVIIIAFVYTLFTGLFVIEGNEVDWETMGKIFFRAVFCIFLILLIPYVISVLYITMRYQRKLIQRLGLNVINENNEPADTKLIHLMDNTGKLRMSLSADMLYYVESQDNYVKIYYESEGKLCNYMLRCTTKAIEDKFGADLIRCHRSFIVNKNKIKLFKNDRDGMFIRLSNDNIKAIPVSKTYSGSIQKALSENQNKK